MKMIPKLGKVNYVDDEGRFVGWQDEQDCCEQHAHWLSPNLSDEALDDYSFDPDFFEEWGPDCEWVDQPLFLEGRNPGKYDFEDGAAVRFRLVSKTGEVAYLILENFHNGYYAHNFSYNFGTAKGNGSL